MRVSAVPRLAASLIGLALVVLAFLWAGSPASGGQAAWQTATPETQGMSSQKLGMLRDSLVSRNTRAFLVIRNDRIHDSAYEPADRMVLARVPKRQITNRGAYEFLKGFGMRREPIWTKAIDERGAVFTHKGKSYRSGISYNTALKRYLWCQTLPGQDSRFKGGFGIYDAPESWGPWTTVFYTEAWDVGPGETSSLPTKWMSADGKTVYMVFSGDDHFSVRRGQIMK